MRSKMIRDYEIVGIGEESTDPKTGKQFLRLDIRQLKETSPTSYWFGEGKLYKARFYDPFHRQAHPGQEDTDENKKRAVLEAIRAWEASA
jgi:hypothetical protein